MTLGERAVLSIPFLFAGVSLFVFRRLGWFPPSIVLDWALPAMVAIAGAWLLLQGWRLGGRVFSVLSVGLLVLGAALHACVWWGGMMDDGPSLSSMGGESPPWSAGRSLYADLVGAWIAGTCVASGLTCVIWKRRARISAVSRALSLAGVTFVVAGAMAHVTIWWGGGMDIGGWPSPSTYHRWQYADLVGLYVPMALLPSGVLLGIAARSSSRSATPK